MIFKGSSVSINYLRPEKTLLRQLLRITLVYNFIKACRIKPMIKLMIKPSSQLK